MKVKTSELSGPFLDLAVLMAIGGDFDEELSHSGKVFGTWGDLAMSKHFSPTNDWSQCGPLIEEFQIDLSPLLSGGFRAEAMKIIGNVHATAYSSREAICKAVAIANLGIEIDVPEELL